MADGQCARWAIRALPSSDEKDMAGSEIGFAIWREGLGFSQGVATHDFEIGRTVQKRVHLGVAESGEVHLPSGELSPEPAAPFPELLHTRDGLRQRAARSTGEFVDGAFVDPSGFPEVGFELGWGDRGHRANPDVL